MIDRNARSPAVSEERLCRGVREDARGCPDRSRRRSGTAPQGCDGTVAARSKHPADARPRGSCDGRAARPASAPGSRVLHRDDLFLYEAAPQQAAFFGLHCEDLPAIDHYYDLSTSLSFGGYEIGVHHTPGHCPGGVCLAIGAQGAGKEDLFVGDTLFAGSIGRTDLPGGDYATLIRSITQVLFSFGDAARVYSGHGPQTTVGQERRSNPFLQTPSR